MVKRLIHLCGALTLILFTLQILTSWIARRTPPTVQLSYVNQRDGANWDIYLLDIERQLPVNLTRGLFTAAARSRLPVWSPDGMQMAFISDEQGVPQVYRYDLMSGQLHQLTERGNIYSSLDWSADGRYLVTGTTTSVPAGLRLIDLESGQVRGLLSQQMSAQHPAFSPNGRQIAFLSGGPDTQRYLYRVEVNGRNLQALIEVSIMASRPVWSPDGRYIAYIDQLGMQQAIYLYDLTQKRVQFLLVNLPLDEELAWNPNGEQIAVPLQLNGVYGAEMVLLRDAGEKLRTNSGLAHDLHYVQQMPYSFQNSPAWSSDGRYLAFVVSEQQNPQSEIYLFDAHTQKVKRLTVNRANDWSPAWRW